MLINQDLYNQIIRKNANKFSNLRVITGYSSAKFLADLHREFPKLKMTVYIGMAEDGGVNKDDHQGYCDLSKDPNLEVYYHVEKPGDHRKIIDFSNQDGEHASYIGSANFSSNGLTSQTEIMTEVMDDLDDLFLSAKEQCLLCTDSQVTKYVTLTDSSSTDKKKSVDDEEIDYDSELFLKKSDTQKYDSSVSVSLLFDKYDYDHTGINAAKPYVTIPQPIACVIPENKIFSLTIGNKRYRGMRQDDLGRKIVLTDGDWFEIAAKYLKLNSKPVKRKELENKRCTNLLFIPKAEDMYEVKFIEEDEGV